MLTSRSTRDTRLSDHKPQPIRVKPRKPGVTGGRVDRAMVGKFGGGVNARKPRKPKTHTPRQYTSSVWSAWNCK